MKRFGFILVLIILSLQGWGQGALQYFNVLDDFHGKGFSDWGTEIISLTDSTYVIACDAQDSVSGSLESYVYARPAFTIINESGAIISKREYFRPYEQLGSTSNGLFIRTSDGGFATAGIWQRWVQGGSGCYYGRYLLKLTSELDSTWMALDSGTMNLNQVLDVRKLALAADGGYVLAGQNHSGRLVMTKFDSSGIHLWNKILPFSCFTFSLTPEPGGGFFLAGTKWQDAFLCKLDAECNIIWERTYNPNPSASSCALGMPLIDGGYFFLYYHLDDFGVSDMEFAWMDASLNVYRSRRLWLEHDQFALKIHELPDHSILVGGRTGHLPMGDNTDRSFLMKISPQGEFLWIRKYYWWFAGYNLNEGFGIAHDGGFILIGSTRDSISSSPYQDTWILKVDSVGCPFPNCGPSLGIQTPNQLESKLVQAYPSPASTRLHLKHGNGGTHEPCSIRLLSIDGKQMDELLMPAGFEQIDFDVSRFPAGLYLWEYRDAEGRNESGRFEVLR